jgi:hypothetical protein
MPLVQRQLIKLILPAEAALSVALFTAQCLDKADAGEAEAQGLRRILTPLLKLRACRDARKAAGDAMEMRGGSGYIEEWIEPRLLREAHLGSIWEGTTNIIALDVVRAASRNGAHRLLADHLDARIGTCDLAQTLRGRMTAVLALLERAADDSALARQAAAGFYYATAAALFLIEAQATGDAVRRDLARLLIAHKLQPHDPLAAADAGDAAAAARVITALAQARRDAADA